MSTGGNRYYLPMPLDFAVLAALPEQGVLGGVHWAGRPLRHVLQEINESLPDGTQPLTQNILMARMRSMKLEGLIEVYQGHGTRIWARTPAGTAFLARKAEVIGDDA